MFYKNESFPKIFTNTAQMVPFELEKSINLRIFFLEDIKTDLEIKPKSIL